jgi:hypothetical protein
MPRVRAKTDGIQMKDWDKDYETPLGEYPGCIGYIWDREFYPGSEINLLEDFDWSAYRELAGDRRRVQSRRRKRPAFRPIQFFFECGRVCCPPAADRGAHGRG